MQGRSCLWHLFYRCFGGGVNEGHERLLAATRSCPFLLWTVRGRAPTGGAALPQRDRPRAPPGGSDGGSGGGRFPGAHPQSPSKHRRGSLLPLRRDERHLSRVSRSRARRHLLAAESVVRLWVI